MDKKSAIKIFKDVSKNFEDYWTGGGFYDIKERRQAARQYPAELARILDTDDPRVVEWFALRKRRLKKAFRVDFYHKSTRKTDEVFANDLIEAGDVIQKRYPGAMAIDARSKNNPVRRRRKTSKGGLVAVLATAAVIYLILRNK